MLNVGSCCGLGRKCLLKGFMYWRFGAQWKQCERWGLWEVIGPWGLCLHQLINPLTGSVLIDYWEVVDLLKVGPGWRNGSLGACLWRTSCPNPFMIPLSTFQPPWGEEPPLPHAPTARMCCPSTWSQVTMKWNF
jgi:hypothetical protein